MSDENFEVQSAASSDISESLRDQILGKGFIRRLKKGPKSVKPGSATKGASSQDSLLGSYVIIPGKESQLRADGDSKSVSQILSYHTARSGSERSLQRLSKHSFRDQKMKPIVESRPGSIQMQTVGIQTGPGTEGEECKCSSGDHDCECSECDHHCHHCIKSIPSVTPEESTDISNLENYTESSSQTLHVRHHPVRNRCTCNCRNYDCERFSDSDDSFTSDFFDLPYQNNEEYLNVLRELEKKLVARNRNRVRKTMMEFEKRSRVNQNLEKPVCDYEDKTVLQKLAPKSHHHKHKHSICCKCGRNKKVNSDILQNEKCWDEMNFVQSVIQTSKCSPNHQIERSLHKSHWQLDPRSGEWVKVPHFQKNGYPRGPLDGQCLKDDIKKDSQSVNQCKKDCCCRQKKRR